MQQNTPREYGWVALVLLVLALLYTYPAGKFLITGEVTQTVSDGTDPATLPYMYGVLERLVSEEPLSLFYGAVPDAHGTVPDPLVLWMSWVEKWIAVFSLPFVPLEQISSVVIIVLMVLNGLCFYLMARSLNWPKPVALALAICWAFNPYSRGRAKVHHALTALYFLPLVFWALIQIKNSTDWKKLAWASLALVGAAMAPHYYLVMTLFFIPFLAAYLLVGKPKSEWLTVSFRATLVSLPALLFLAWCFLNPIPQSLVKEHTALRPETGSLKDETGVHPFLKTFSARPIDYLSGDVAIGLSDLNPLRGVVNSWAAADNFGGANGHERANGIRWLVILCLVLALRQRVLKGEGWVFLALAGFGFLLSLRPDFLGGHWLPSYWLHQLVSQFRVPSRASLFVHFGLLMVAGAYLIHVFYERVEPKQKSAKKKKGADAPATEPTSPPAYQPKASKWAKRLTATATLPLLAVVDFPPLMNSMPVAPIMPKYSHLTDPSLKECGAGMYFPYVSQNFALAEMYYFLQRLRGTHCDYINGSSYEVRNQKLLQNFALHQNIMSAIQRNDPGIRQRLVNFARCVPLEWLVFDKRVPAPWAASVCQEMGWVWDGKEVCHVSQHKQDMVKAPEECL